MKSSWFRLPEPWIFVLLLASSAYFWQSRDWNIASRLMLTYALVDRGTLSIDGLDDQTRDLARYQDHYYSDKTPGFSLLAVPPYLLARNVLRLPPHPLNQPGFAHWPADYWVTLGTSGLCTALSGILLVGLARDLGCGPRRSALVGLTYGLGTPAFAYATMSYGHQVAALGLLGSLALLWREGGRSGSRMSLAGFLAGFASVVEIQVGPVSAILGLYLIALVFWKRRPPWAIVWFGLGAAIPTLILLTYNDLAFGSPWRMGYFYEVLDRFKEVHSSSNPLGMGRPDWSRLDDLLWGERRGLIWFAPVVVLTVPGLVALAARKFWDLAIVSALAIASVVLVNLSYPEWTGGWSTGPRLLVPMLPFAVLPVAALLALDKKSITSLVVALSLLGYAIILTYVLVGARIPDAVARPWFEGVWPILRGDRPVPPWVFGQPYARNLVNLALPSLPRWLGWTSVMPLIGFQASWVGLMNWVIRVKRS